MDAAGKTDGSVLLVTSIFIKFLSEYTLNGESRKMGLQSKSHFLFIKRTNYVR